MMALSALTAWAAGAGQQQAGLLPQHVAGAIRSWLAQHDSRVSSTTCGICGVQAAPQARSSCEASSCGSALPVAVQRRVEYAASDMNVAWHALSVWLEVCVVFFCRYQHWWACQCWSCACWSQHRGWRMQAAVCSTSRSVMWCCVQLQKSPWLQAKSDSETAMHT